MTVPTKEALERMRNMSLAHVSRYIETNGQDGHVWRNGAPTLLLTTEGRRSHEKHTTPLIYGRDGESYLIVASMGGSDRPPHWYLNLIENSQVDLQVAAERFRALARTASSEEKARLWPVMIAVWPGYDDYQSSTHRDIPIVILERQ